MKRKTAKEILAESFREIAQNKSVDRITVREITENCGYSTATFYRQFKDKYDLIAWDYTCSLRMIMDQVGNGDFSWRNMTLAGALFYSREQKYLANLLLHTSGYDSFLRNMKQMHYESLAHAVLASGKLKRLDTQMQMTIRMYCQGTVDLSCDWILGKYDASPQELAQVYQDCLPLSLHPYLLPGE